GEVVEHVEVGHLQPASDLLGAGRAGVGRLEGVVHPFHRPQLPGAEGVLHRPGETGDGVTTAEVVARAQTRGGVVVGLVVHGTAGRVVLVVAVVVEDDAAGRQVGQE